MSTLTTKNAAISVRTIRPDDGPALYEIVRHALVARTLLQLPSMEYRETDQWLKERDRGHHRFVAVRSKQVVGSVSLVQPQRARRIHSGTLGLMVHPDHWRTGVGRTLMEAILDLADNWLNLRRVDLGVLANNPAAEHLYRNFGFEREGTRRDAVFTEGHLIDEHLMARLRGPLPAVEPGTRPRFSRRTDVVNMMVRPLQAEDAEALHEIISDPAVARGLNQVPSLELADVIKKVEAGGPGLFRYSAVAEHKDGTHKVVGNVTMRQYQNPRLAHTGHLGLSVHRDYWGIGIGSLLMSTVVDLADQWLNLSRLELEVYTDNDAAIHLYERFGFEIEGTHRLHSYGDGRWSDSYFMARVRTP